MHPPWLTICLRWENTWPRSIERARSTRATIVFVKKDTECYSPKGLATKVRSMLGSRHCGNQFTGASELSGKKPGPFDLLWVSHLGRLNVCFNGPPKWFPFGLSSKCTIRCTDSRKDTYSTPNMDPTPNDQPARLPACAEPFPLTKWIRSDITRDHTQITAQTENTITLVRPGKGHDPLGPPVKRLLKGTPFCSLNPPKKALGDLDLQFSCSSWG